MHILREWLRAPVFGSTSFFRSRSVLPRTRTTFSRREISRLAWTSLSVQRARSLLKPICRAILARALSSCADRIHRIYNGLNLAEFERAEFSSTPPLIVAIGRLIAKKGFTDLVRACGLLGQRGASFRCEIIGEGPLEQELRDQVQELNLQSRMTFSGAQPQHEVRRRLAAANVFVLPSVVDAEGGSDNLPTVIMEAMATGLPVISTNVGGISEMVIENETGFLVQPGDAIALADRIEKVINDRSLAQKLVNAGSERVRKLFLNREERGRIVRVESVAALYERRSVVTYRYSKSRMQFTACR